MGDYYRVVFRRLIGRTGPRAEIPIPRSLRFVYSASSVLAILGWLLVVGLGRFSPLTDDAPWLLHFYLTFPIWVVLYLGFSEQQSWTRALMIALLLAATMLSWFCGLVYVPIGIAVLTLLSAVYLYRSPVVRRYYAECRKHAVVRIEAVDFRGTVFIPLYTSIAGAILGALLAIWVISELSAETPAVIRDVTGAACMVILAAVVAGVLCRWLGEAIVSRISRHDRSET